jgi:hypothetical protein
MYHKFCKDQKFSPDKLKNFRDLEKIPLIPGEFYKDYPIGKDFALWLANIITGDIPEIKISGKNPSFDEVINSFNETGMKVAYSSGTSGRHTFIPRDKRTFNIAEYAGAKVAVTMAYPMYDYNLKGYLLMPNPFKTNVFAGRVCTVFFDAISEVIPAIDREINTDLIKMTMTGGSGLKVKLIKKALKRMNEKIIKNIIKWLEKKRLCAVLMILN